MNWGNSLLGLLKDLTQSGFKGFFLGLLYEIKQAVGWVIYKFWSLLAWVCDGIESVFRKLAGLDSAQNNDMATAIIRNEEVQNIFGNMVGLSMALLIFFTILKIIQQHYKEKDGGNPYIIVFRMFKGMMMFFFVTGAVLVGLYASGVVFRGLDAATGNKSNGIGGTIFGAMADDANRLLLGLSNADDNYADEDNDEGINNSYGAGMYYSRLKDKDNKNKCYFIVGTGTGDGATVASKRLSAAELFPDYQYGVVDGNGKVRPLVEVQDWLTDDTLADENSNHYWQGQGSTDGVSSVGYHNDLLQAVHTRITPKIDIKLSPINKIIEDYEIKAEEAAHDISQQITVMGTGVRIPMSYQKVKYGLQYSREEDMYDGFFCINIGGQASLQNGNAAASFDLDAYATDKPFDKVMLYLLANNTLCILTRYAIQSIPALPLYFQIYGVGIDLSELLSIIVKPFLDNLLDAGLSTLTNGVYDKCDFITLTAGPKAPLELTQYKFAPENFVKVWENVSGQVRDFAEQVSTESERAQVVFDQIDEGAAQIEKDGTNMKTSVGEWAQYANYVDRYNDTVIGLLKQIGAANKTRKAATVGSDEETESTNAIIECFKSLCAEYEIFKTAVGNGVKPRNLKAAARVGKIYQPLFTTSVTALAAQDVKSITDIGKLIKNYNFNFGISGSNLFRCIDWDQYEILTKPSGNHTDLYPEWVNKSTSGVPADIAFNAGDTNGDITEALLLLGGYTNASEFPKASVTAYKLPTKKVGNQEVPTFEKAAKNSQELLWDFKTNAGSVLGQNDSYYQGQIQVASLDLGLGATNIDPRENLAPSAFTVKSEPAPEVNVRPSQASRNLFMQSLEQELKPQDSLSDAALASVLEQMNIVTFRRRDENGLFPQDKKSDVKALSEWCKSSVTIKPGIVGSQVRFTGDYTAQALNAMMKKKDTNRYLLLGNKDMPNAQDCTMHQYIGIMSYTDGTTVKVIYDMWHLNYFIGYTGIVVALGVYMGFVFGLIQRVVNMAVLYIMSPITIAFFPFDDGSKFNSAFVMPFYKETISAFAIILSLNIFFLLYPTVGNKANSVVGDGVAGKLVEVLALIAFCSMLPKIRDTITNMLGANSIQSKSIADTWTDMKKAITPPPVLTDNARKKLRAGVGGLLDNRKVSKLAREQKKHDALALKAAMGDKWAQRKLEKSKNKLNKLQEQDDRIQKAHDAVKNGASVDEAGKNLNKRDQRMFKRQNKAALKRALQEMKSGAAETEASLQRAIANEKDPVKKAALEQRLKDLQEKAKQNKTSIDQELQKERAQELVDDKNFRRSVSGVLANKVGNLRNIGANIKQKFKYTLVGDLAKTIFNPVTGLIADNKLVKWKVEQRDRIDQQRAKEAAYEGRKLEGLGRLNQGFTDYSETLLEQKRLKKLAIMQQAAHEQAADADEAELLMHARAKILVEKGQYKTFKDAMDNAGVWSGVNDDGMMLGAAEVDAMVKKLGGVDKLRADYAKDLELGRNGLKIGEKYANTAEVKFNELVAVGADGLKLKRKDLGKISADNMNLELDNLIGSLGIEDAKLTADIKRATADVINAGGTEADIMAAIKEKLPEGNENRNTEAIMGHITSSGLSSALAAEKFKLGGDAILLDGALNHLKKEVKAEEFLYKNTGLSTDDSRVQKIRQIYNDMYDEDQAGSMVNMQKQLSEQRDAGKITDSEYKRRYDAIQKEFTARYDAALQSMNAQHAGDFVHFTRDIEREEAQRTVTLGKAYEKRISYQVNVNLTESAKNVIFKDSHWVNKRVEDGDYTTVAREMEEAVAAAKSQDYAKLESMGLDKETVEKFKEWSKSDSGLSELNKIYDYASTTSKYMGDVDGVTGGNSTAAIRNQMASIYQMIETKEISEFYKRKVQMAAKQEESLRNALSVFAHGVQDSFAGDEWEKMKGTVNLTYMGNKSLGEYMKDVTERISNGLLSETDAEFKQIKEEMYKLANDWDARKGALSVKMAGNQAAQTIKAMLGMMDNGVQANICANDQDYFNNLLSGMMGRGNEIFGKLEKDGMDYPGKR